MKFLVYLVLAAQLAGCGTLMYPERRGQRGGRIDVGVAVLDGIGLLFFLIPGIIAFAVDFHEGTIYLPAGTTAKFDPRHSNAATIEGIIWKETGYRVKLNQDTVEASRLKSLEEMRKRFAEVLKKEKNIRVVLSAR